MIKPGIYALLDPLTNNIRYIGRSTNWPKRSKRHLNPSELKKSDTYNSRWIKQLLTKNLKPVIKLIEKFPITISNEELNQAEIRWIAHYKSLGYKLTNETPGGEGHPISENTKQKIKAKLTKPNAKRHQPKIRLSKDELIKAQPHSCKIIDQNGIIYDSIKDAARKLNLSFVKISDILHGRRYTTGGYSFKHHP